AIRVCNQSEYTDELVRVPVRALVEINADAGLELVLPEERTLREEADAVFGLEPVAGLVLMQRRRSGVQRRRQVLPRRRIGARVRASRIVIRHVSAVP